LDDFGGRQDPIVVVGDEVGGIDDVILNSATFTMEV
jgi:hypothetical protein